MPIDKAIDVVQYPQRRYDSYAELGRYGIKIIAPDKIYTSYCHLLNMWYTH